MRLSCLPENYSYLACARPYFQLKDFILEKKDPLVTNPPECGLLIKHQHKQVACRKIKSSYLLN